jgi:PIN domain nuclease of toxin-antitoxin system
MIAYIDTNAVIWLSDGRTRPSSHETIRLTDLAELLISPMVVLELELLDQILRIKQSAPDVQTKIEHELGVQVCGLSFGDVAEPACDENWTRDPFDRMIVAQAKMNGLAYLIPSDKVIAKHYARMIW